MKVYKYIYICRKSIQVDDSIYLNIEDDGWARKEKRRVNYLDNYPTAGITGMVTKKFCKKFLIFKTLDI